MKWARFDGNRVIETTEVDPKGRFHHSVRWAIVPDEVTPNSVRDGETWTIYKPAFVTREDYLRDAIKGMENDPGLSAQLARLKAELAEVQARIDAAAIETNQGVSE